MCRPVRESVMHLYKVQKVRNQAKFVSIVSKMGNKTTAKNETNWGNTFNNICKLTFKLDREAFRKMGSIC